MAEMAAVAPRRLTSAQVQAKIDEIGFGPAQLLALAATGGIMFSEGSEVLIMGTITTLLRGHWELSAFVRGSMVAIVFVGFAVGNLVSGYVGDRFGRRRSILLAYVLIGTFGFLTGIAVHPAMMVSLRFCVGAGCGVGFPSVYSLIPEVCPSHLRGALSTLMIGFMPIGELFAAVLVLLLDPELIHSRGHCEVEFYPNLLFPRECSWRSMCEISALPSFAFMLLAYFCLAESPQWLCAQGRDAEAIEALARMARINGRTAIDLSFSSGRPTPDATPRKNLTAAARARAATLPARAAPPTPPPVPPPADEAEVSQARVVRMAPDEEAPGTSEDAVGSLGSTQGLRVTDEDSMEMSASEVFRMWDTDGDGELTRDEMINGLMAMLGDFEDIPVDSLDSDASAVPLPRNRTETEAWVGKVEEELDEEQGREPPSGAQSMPLAQRRYTRRETEACILKLRRQARGRRATIAAAAGRSPRSPRTPRTPRTPAPEAYTFTAAITTLLRQPWLPTTLFMFLAHFTKDFSVFGLNYVLPQFFHALQTHSVGAHLLMMSAISVPGVLIAFAMTRSSSIGHIQSMQCAAGVCAVFTVGMLEISPDAFGAPCAFLCKSAAFAYFICAVVYTAEVFPTAIRNTAVGFCTCFGRAGSISAPLIFELSHEHAQGSFDIFMLLLASLMGAIAISAPWALRHETKGQMLDEDESQWLDEEHWREAHGSDETARLAKAGGPGYGAAETC